jgi:hypothetical protein
MVYRILNLNFNNTILPFPINANFTLSDIKKNVKEYLNISYENRLFIFKGKELVNDNDDLKFISFGDKVLFLNIYFVILFFISFFNF